MAIGSPDTSLAEAARGAPRLLFRSDWSGTSQIYAADPAGIATAQITFARAPACGTAPCGYDDPMPSPDGRYVLFTDWASCEPTLHPPSLFVARADGSHRRVLVRSQSKSRCISGVSGAWSPDSKYIAYNVDGVIHIIGLNGRNDRTVGRGTEFTWSPDGRSLAYQTPTGSLWVRRGRRARMIAIAVSEFSWSPNARWLAYSFRSRDYGPDELDMIRPNGTGRRALLTAYLLHPMWAGDSRLLAAWTTEGVAIVDVPGGMPRLLNAGSDLFGWRPHARELAVERPDGTYLLNADTGAARLLTGDRPSEAAWSPDGRSLAYVGPEAVDSRGDLRVVDVAGGSRTIVRAAGAYGGWISDLRWTRAPAGAQYQAPRPRHIATVRDDGLTAPWPIVRIAADGEHVAYVSCGHVFVWTPSTRSVVQTEPMASLSPRCSLPEYYVAFWIYTLAVSGDRVGYGDLQGNMGQTWALHAGPVDDPARVTELGRVGSASGCVVGNGGLGDLTGAGGVLVFSRWRDNYAPCPTKTVEQQIYRVDAGGCPCPAIAASPGALAPFDVDGGRIVAGGENATVVFDANGTQLTAVPVSPLAAQLSGSHLVVLVQGRLLDYDAGSGTPLHSWSLPDVPSGGECGSPHSGTWRCGNPRLLLEDAARSLVTYVLDGQVHVLQLADGRDAPVGAGTLARFTATGLVYADDGTLRLVPYAQLPIHP